MPEENVTPSNQVAAPRNSLGIPVAIVIAAALIAGAIYMSNMSVGKGATAINVQKGIDAAQNPQVTPEMEVAPVTEADHIMGNPNAPILIVEYSDYDCPYCKFFHETMTKIMDEYGPTGKVAWVYRHFPLETLHPNAQKIAAASKCVAELGGNDAFWTFSEKLFESRELVTLENGQQTIKPTDMTKLSTFAQAGGVDEGEFDLCFNSGKYDESVKADVAAAIKTGARGTPYSIMIVGEEQGVINGAQPYETVKQMINNVISQMEG